MSSSLPDAASETLPFEATPYSRVALLLADQAVISLGTFAVNIGLARTLAITDYGTFVIIWSVFLALQVFNITLVHYPLGIQLAVVNSDERARVTATGLTLAVATTLLMSLAAVAAFSLQHSVLLAVSAMLCLIAWQLLATTRRILLSNFRVAGSVIGNAVAYGGQAGALLAFAAIQPLSLPAVFLVSAAAFAAGFVVHLLFLQPRLQIPPLSALIDTLREYWAMGSIAMGTEFAFAGRQLGTVWLIGLVAGTAAMASYQACFFIVAAINPIILGLLNILTQVTAKAYDRRRSSSDAWMAARPYLIVGLPLCLAYLALVTIIPGNFLTLFYGNSPYSDLGDELRVLAVFAAMSAITELVLGMLFGMGQGTQAFRINLKGLLAAVLVVPPLAAGFGILKGCALALCCSELLRLWLAFSAMPRAPAPGER